MDLQAAYKQLHKLEQDENWVFMDEKHPDIMKLRILWGGQLVKKTSPKQFGVKAIFNGQPMMFDTLKQCADHMMVTEETMRGILKGTYGVCKGVRLEKIYYSKIGKRLDGTK